MHYDKTRSRRPGAAEDRHAAKPAGEAADPKARDRQRTTCAFPGCNAPHHAKGYCKSHYSRARRRGKARGSGSRASRCEIAGCSRPAVRSRRCAVHLTTPAGGPRRMTTMERLAEIRRRHELMRREIEQIRQSFENEGDD
jgi:hypothetical protein